MTILYEKGHVREDKWESEEEKTVKCEDFSLKKLIEVLSAFEREYPGGTVDEDHIYIDVYKPNEDGSQCVFSIFGREYETE